MCGLACRERANLSLQLKDTKTVVGRLQWVIGLILHIIAFFIYLTIFDVGHVLIFGSDRIALHPSWQLLFFVAYMCVRGTGPVVPSCACTRLTCSLDLEQ